MTLRSSWQATRDPAADDPLTDSEDSPRKALVTGAAAGIGAAIAIRLRGAGIEVVTLDREPGCDLQVDLREHEIPELPDIDICVSNAAITDTIAAADRLEHEAWTRDIEVNLTGSFRAIQACLGGMRERRWGRIVVISSIAARDGLPGQVSYAASKAGLIGMVKTLAAENVRRGITANAVLPGMVATEKVRAMPQEILEALGDLLPMKRMADPEEVAALVTFLSSEIAGSITGESIGIDGGASLNTMSLTRALRDRGGWR
ncbi:MAG TPA: SDR family NAD(P)-dependent oxidoreductase [Solirubrobacterales bacterium]|nr:SDR family NAD(P)-dependent oxidoreductase [Solirubrobacterales bacterium]